MRSVWFAAVLLVPVGALAESTHDIELTVFDPTPSTVGKSIHLQTPSIGQPGDLAISSWVSYAAKPLVIETNFNPDVNVVVRHRTLLVLGGAYTLDDRFELGARMPFYMQSGDPPPADSTTTYRDVAPSGAALGDLALHGKMQFSRSEAWAFGGGLTLKVPTASEDQFAGTDLPTGRLLFLAAFSPHRQLTLLANAGAIVRKEVQYANNFYGFGATGGAGATYRIAHSVFLDLEVFGDLVPNGRRDLMKTEGLLATSEVLAGAHVQVTPQFALAGGAGTGLIAGPGAPQWRAVLSFAYTPSGRALPPLRKPEVVVPVDLTKQDTDFDKFVDAVDKCPEQREDKDGYQDDDGCPDLDNDADGVPDEKDKCVSQAEDRDKFEDGDGCPEDDNDKDGVVDAKDACPAEPEKINGVDDNDGCPDKGESLVISTPDRLELLESVAFKDNAVAKSSANVLGQLATTLRARDDIVRLRIGVHVQPTNKPDKDQALSDKRAAAVRDWLVRLGIQAERIDPKGFGGTKPLVPPSQKGAAGINDRVELIILERH